MDENENIIIDVSSLPALLGASLGDIGTDLTEIAVDSILKDGLLKDIPIVGAIAGFCKLGISIRERNLLKQTLEFINAFNTGTIKPEKLEAYIQEINTSPKKAEKELGRCLLILNTTIEAVHSRLFGRLFNAYVNGAILWDKFVELSDAAQRLFIEDIKHLKEIDRQPDKQVADKTGDVYNYFRLQSIGLLTSSSGEFDYDDKEESGVVALDTNVFKISPFGKTFIQNSGLRDMEID